MCPYIDGIARDSLHDRIRLPGDVGELTYSLQQILSAYLMEKPMRYQQIAECLGALEGCKLDFIERVVKPYEARKQKENGDVWPAALTGQPDLVGGVNDEEAAARRIHTYTTDEVREKLLKGEITVNGIRSLEAEGRIKLSSRHFGIVPGADHPLAGRGRFATREGEIIRLSGQVRDADEVRVWSDDNEILPLTAHQLHVLRARGIAEHEPH